MTAVPPCKDCAARYVGCHGRHEDGRPRCESYGVYETAKAAEDAQRQELIREREIDRYQRRHLNELSVQAGKKHRNRRRK